MSVDSRTLNLTPPRYVPFTIKGTVLAAWHDSREGRYLVLCPKCHKLIAYDKVNTLYLELVSNDRQCCQGCRARISFEKDPGLIGLFLDFWHRTGTFPESTSWVEAIPQPLLNLWAKEVRAAMQTEWKKSEEFRPALKEKSDREARFLTFVRAG